MKVRNEAFKDNIDILFEGKQKLFITSEYHMNASEIESITANESESINASESESITAN